MKHVSLVPETENAMTDKVHTQRKWWIFFTTSLVMIMTNIDFSAVTLALAQIANELQTQLTTVVWIISGYASAAAAFAIVGGRLADIYGYRKTFLWGIIIFTVTSVWIGFSHGKWDLIIPRVIQGAGAAICWPLCVVIVSTSFPEEQRGEAVAYTLGVGAIALVIGPVVGGIILHFLSWRWIFFINLPIGILVVIFSILFLPNVTRQDPLPLHYPSAILAVISILCLTTALNEGPAWGLNSLLFQILFWVGLILIILFIISQRYIKNPLVNFNLFKNLIIRTSLIMRIINQIVFISVIFIFGLLLQNILSYSPIQTSFVLFSLTAAISIASLSCGKIINVHGTKNLILIALILNLIACLWLALIPPVKLFNMIMPLILLGVGAGILIPSLTTLVLFQAGIEHQGTISGVNYSSLYLGNALATVMSNWILHIASDYHLRQLPLEPRTVSGFLGRILRGVDSIQHFRQQSFEMVEKLIPWLQHAFFQAFSVIMWCCFGVTIMSLFLYSRIRAKI